jgi:ABC-2 type transport system ATP-binding protein
MTQKNVTTVSAGVRVNQVSFAYKTQKALDSVSLEFGTPGVYALVGANGSGKTTLLQLLYGLLRPSAGDIILTNAHGNRCLASDISFVPDDDTLIQDLTGAEYLAFVADCFGMPRAAAKTRIAALLRLFLLEEASTRLVRGYSHGMRKKLQLAAGVLVPADIVIIDEPTNGLDPLATALASEVISRAAQKQIVILATHNLSLAETIADQVVMLRQKVIARGTPKDIMRAHGVKSLQQAYVALSGTADNQKLLTELFAV